MSNDEEHELLVVLCKLTHVYLMSAATVAVGMTAATAVDLT